MNVSNVSKDDGSTGNAVDLSRRRLMSGLAVGGLAAVALATAAKAEPGTAADLPFPGEDAAHKVVYQFNKGDAEYHQHVLFSVGAVLRHYGDNVKIVVTCIGPGIHILAKKPKRPVANEIRERVSSLNTYGIEFHACGNTLNSLKWTAADIVPFAKIVEVGAVDLIELQEKGFSYISW